MKLTFLGGSGTVTGSKYLLEEENYKLLVDCGLFQGIKNLRLKNWASLPVAPRNINDILLTHAHIDHSGLIPVLCRDGFKGHVHCSPATKDLCNILLPDSGRLQEEDAHFTNKKGFGRHREALPLYTEEAAIESLRSFKAHEFFEEFLLGPFKCRLIPSGHILGAASVHITSVRSSKSVIFSGDLGRRNDIIMPPPQCPGEADLIIMESTYGHSNHAEMDPLLALETVMKRTYARNGILLVPVFAVGRAQVLQYVLYELMKERRIPELPIIINSPMAEKVGALYPKYQGQYRLSEKVLRKMFQATQFVSSVEESKKLNEKKGPMVVLSASGMLTGGRVLHHVSAWGGDPRNTLLLVGYQAEGTRGSHLLHGVTELKIHGQYVPIRCEVANLDLFSAHADQRDLLDWLQQCVQKKKSKVYLVHGEPFSSDILRMKIEEKLQLKVKVAEFMESITL